MEKNLKNQLVNSDDYDVTTLKNYKSATFWNYEIMRLDLSDVSNFNSFF